MNFFKRTDEGFTLVELMVVVAIIGILSAVAIPNFKKYQAKSKTSEAKLQLASVYSAEAALQSDYDSFGTCLADAGYVSPNGQWAVAAPTSGNNYYSVGFPADNATINAIIVANGGVCDNSTSKAYGVSAYKKVGGARTTYSNLNFTFAAGMGDGSMTTAGISTDGGSFIISAIGIIDAGNNTAAKANQWAIDQNKTLRQFNVGF